MQASWAGLSSRNKDGGTEMAVHTPRKASKWLFVSLRVGDGEGVRLASGLNL